MPSQINEFELQSLYYIHFRTNIRRIGMNSLFPQRLIKQYFYCFIKYDFGIRYPTKFDVL